MNETNSKQEKVGSLLSAFKFILGIVGSGSAVIYAAGFIIVSTHLISYGLTDVSLAGPRYLSVGAFLLSANHSNLDTFCMANLSPQGIYS